MFATLDGLVSVAHPYRKFEAIVDFCALAKPLTALYSDRGRPELGAERAFRMLVLQFLEDISDREMERFMRENLAAKWFCGFGLSERTPDHSFFGDFRKRLGTKGLMDIFNHLRVSLKAAGLIREVFTFVDASQLVSKLSTWDDRDKAIAKGLEKFSNETASKVAADKQARFGAKGKDKFWYGYKEHTSVDMQSGLVNKVAATPANVDDAKGLRHVCPEQGAVYADKGYCTAPAQKELKRKGCHSAVIEKNNMIGKNRDKDRWLSKMRAPYERVFSKRSKKVRYRGQAKAQFQVACNALGHNLKRLVVLGVEKIPIVTA
jgi:IS5 family transposase